MSFKILDKYLPSGTSQYIEKIIDGEPIIIRITGPRSSRLGAFSARKNSNYKAINISGNLNPYSFLITLLHEIAHMKIWLKHGKNMEAHGTEWKTAYQELIAPLIPANIFPPDVSMTLTEYFKSNNKTDATYHSLTRILRAYDTVSSEKVSIETIPDGSCFYFGRERLFRKIKIIRKRYLCKEIKTGRNYLFSPLAEVKPERQ